MSTTTYTNPVYPDYFADPFVLEHQGEYYAFGTSDPTGDDDHAFEVLHSPNLIDWTSCGGSLERLPDSAKSDYWAPEVAFHGGTFYMYYSVGAGDEGHHLRVATSRSPAGPFEDTGRNLTPDLPFAIDAHPFQDTDGAWYLYYARDFLDGERVGTALEVDRLHDMVTLGGEPRTVLRATSDWQIFKRGRTMYGRTYDWHTLEGPFVVRRHERYCLFYSGGAWEQPNYGVSYALAESPLGPFREPASNGPTLLASVPGAVIGPGHNSIVRGPDGADYIVYHAWDPAKTARRMCIDRLRWRDGKPETDGPTSTRQQIR